MPHTVTLTDASNAMNQFCVQFGPRINQIMRQGLEFERDLEQVQCEHTYTGTDVNVSDALQPYQSQFTPNNTEEFTGIDSTLRPAKVDLLFTAAQLEQFFSKWKCNWFTPDPNEIRSTYAGYVIGQHILPKLIEELNLASYAGEYVAPTAGTPGAVLESFDGFETNVLTHISDGRLTPITTGALVESTMVAQVRAFCKAVPEPYRYKTGKIYMSKTNAQKYADNYQTAYPARTATIDTPDSMYQRVDHYNKTIVGMTCMEGSDRMIMQFDNLPGMLVGKRTGFAPYFNFRFQEFDRTLKCLAEIYRFFNFETCLNTFVNDQGVIV